MTSPTSSEATAPTRDTNYNLTDYTNGDNEPLVVLPASAYNETTQALVRLGSDIALNGVKAGQSLTENKKPPSKPYKGSVVIDVLLVLIIIAIVAASLFIVLVPSSAHDNKLIETVSSQLFSLPAIILSFFAGKNRSGSG
jgi:hypothetical protein